MKVNFIVNGHMQLLKQKADGGERKQGQTIERTILNQEADDGEGKQGHTAIATQLLNSP